MRRLLMAAVALAMAAVVAQDASGGRTIRRRRMGSGPGYERLLAPRQGKLVRFVHGRSAVPRSVLEQVARSVEATLSVPVEVAEGTSASGALADGEAAVAVALDGRPGAPALLAAPEDGWAVVGVDALGRDAPSEAVLHARVRKEVWRALAYSLGVGHEAVPSVLRPVFAPTDLETMDTECPSPVALALIADCAVRRGVGRIRYVSYRQACREGWAPAPTNDAQRAFWEQARADKERGPTKPITIRPPGGG